MNARRSEGEIGITLSQKHEGSAAQEPRTQGIHRGLSGSTLQESLKSLMKRKTGTRRKEHSMDDLTNQEDEHQTTFHRKRISNGQKRKRNRNLEEKQILKKKHRGGTKPETSGRQSSAATSEIREKTIAKEAREAKEVLAVLRNTRGDKVGK